MYLCYIYSTPSTIVITSLFGNKNMKILAKVQNAGFKPFNISDNDPKNWDRYRFAFCQTSRGIARSVKSYAKKGFTLKAIKVIENVPDKITWTVFCTKSKKERFYAYRLGGKIMGTFLYSHATKFKTKELNKVVNEVKELYPGYNIQCNLVDL